MVSIELFVLSIVRTLVEVTMFVFIGQGVLALFAGNKRHTNFVYQLFMIVTQPICKVVRKITPRFVADPHIPLVSFFIVFWLWIGLNYAKRVLCVVKDLPCF